ncbi:MAG: TlpA disulfide reductase family protein [Pyrinomonadaceae bacterium]|nr:TlpA disulfide reductase family protein [Pyrinomonadaceae bacterium]
MNEGSIAAKPAKDKAGVKKRVLEWAGYFLVMGLFLFFFAPESWWQFGVSPATEREMGEGFVLKTFDGAKEWNFDEKRGKVLVVNYWATWCPPCRIETPGLVSFAEEHREKGVEVVGVTLDEDLSLVGPFVENYKISYPILLPGNDPNLPPGNMALPTTFLYDKQGRLAKKYTGLVLESTLRADTAKLLAE